MTVAGALTINPLGHAAPVSDGGEADWAHPVLGETWHGTVTGIQGSKAHVRWHSYTPAGGGRRKPMRHATRVPVHALTPGRRRIAIKALAAAAAQPDNTGGCMLALYPPPSLAEALAVQDGLPAGEIHLTVAYAGDAADVDPAALQTVAGQLARRNPVTAAIAGHARFTGGDDKDVIVALADGSALEDLRRDAMDRLAAQGITVPRDHGYTPHLTLRYADRGDPDPVGRLKPAPVTFAGISAVHGGDRTDYPFAGDPAETARRPAAPGHPPKPEHTGGGMSTAASKALFEEALHPRDPDGRWATGEHERHALPDAARVAAAATGPDALAAAPVRTNGHLHDLAWEPVDDGPGLAPRSQVRDLHGVPGPQAADAVGDYASNGHRHVNHALRSARGDLSAFPDRTGDPHYTRRRAEGITWGLDAVMAESPLASDVVVHRGVTHPERMFGDAWLPDGDMTGAEYTDHGFTSTTTAARPLAEHTGYGAGATLRIFAPAGTPAIGVPQRAGGPLAKEREWRRRDAPPRASRR